METIKDIAKATGVSAMTVSRYFNEPDKLRPKTYEKIKEAVEKMEYQPNMMARLLATRKPNIICVYIAGDIGTLHPFTLQALAGIGERLGENDYSMLLCRDTYERKNCDGIIAMGLSTEEETELQKYSTEKAVIIFGNNSNTTNWVDINNYNGSYMATKHMIECGYKTIGYIGIDNRQRYTEQRHQGYLDCMKEYGMEVPKYADKKVPNHEDDGYRAVEEIFKENSVDGIVCASDVLALGVSRYANENNIEIPDKLGIIGFDGLGYEKLVTPVLSTIQQPVYEAGKYLAERMVEVLKSGEYAQTQKFIEPILKINGSTKKIKG